MEMERVRKTSDRRKRSAGVSSYRCLCMRALKAMPSFQLVVKFVMLTLGYLQVPIQQGISMR